ncbi:hypothetical protein NDN08_006426 [Rhodosorus marinus]|uniref:Translation initiation factor IF-2, mitochondrial n=1 Tax=Rhodosorus marinus TaxID=101924 RepID=A0AAV8UKS0_9RHOD|nr:hypothetical protein NDN08_006426 [Rhodosorus marinus]
MGRSAWRPKLGKGNARTEEEWLNLKAKRKWATRNHEFKELLDRRKGMSNLPADDVSAFRRPPPVRTPAGDFKRRLRSLHGGTIRVFDNTISIQDFAANLSAPTEDILEAMKYLGEADLSPTSMLSREDAEILASELGCKIVEFKPRLDDRTRTEVADVEVLKSLPRRPPVITVMGHVDHGKTTIIDWLRKSNIVKGEVGGITQSIGSFKVSTRAFDGKKSHLCIIDTPGHAAFQQMRERGANVTDIVLLVVAADDGPLATTLEAINQAKHATIIVAINKIDLPNADVVKTKKKLAEVGVLVEELGGKTQCVEVSAVKGTNMEVLVETISFQADLLDLHADPSAPGEAVCLEAYVDKKTGPMAKAIVRWGTLRPGDIIVCGKTHGRVKFLRDEHGNNLKDAPPSTPALLCGLRECPEAGSDILVVESEREVNKVLRSREEIQSAHVDLGQEEAVPMEERNLPGDLYQTAAVFIIKAVDQGSLEAIHVALQGLEKKGVKMYILSSSVGDVKRGEANIAYRMNATILALGVKTDREVPPLLAEMRGRWKAERAVPGSGVPERAFFAIRNHRVIYRLLEDAENICKMKAITKYRDVVRGTATVLKVFNFGPKIGLILGCRVDDGELTIKAKARVKRGTETVFEGPISSLKIVKDEVMKVSSGTECGVGMTGAELIEEGDVIETFEVVKNDFESLPTILST